MRSKCSICCESVSKAHVNNGHVNHGHDSSSEPRGRLFLFFRRFFSFFRLVDFLSWFFAL